jgi:hypothetical protein
MSTGISVPIQVLDQRLYLNMIFLSTTTTSFAVKAVFSTLE